jgi:hypothetical protein
MVKLDYLTDLTRNALALSYELQDTELMELLEDAFQEIEKLKKENENA